MARPGTNPSCGMAGARRMLVHCQRVCSLPVRRRRAVPRRPRVWLARGRSGRVPTRTYARVYLTLCSTMYRSFPLRDACIQYYNTPSLTANARGRRFLLRAGRVRCSCYVSKHPCSLHRRHGQHRLPLCTALGWSFRPVLSKWRNRGPCTLAMLQLAAVHASARPFAPFGAAFSNIYASWHPAILNAVPSRCVPLARFFLFLWHARSLTAQTCYRQFLTVGIACFEHSPSSLLSIDCCFFLIVPSSYIYALYGVLSSYFYHLPFRIVSLALSYFFVFPRLG